MLEDFTMKHTKNIPATIVVSCKKCGRTERVAVTDVGDGVYKDDIMYELGWYNDTCPTCQQLDKIEKKRR